jgi:uncharacterized protein (DUF2141 family)
MSKLTFILFLSIFAICSTAQTNTSLVLKISNIKNTKGKIRVAFYNSTASFPKENKFFFAKEFTIANTGEMSFSITEIPYGNYAVAVFQDINNNQTLDKNFVGYPKEPFGFSNNYKPVISAPKFADCSFSFSKSSGTISIKLL